MKKSGYSVLEVLLGIFILGIIIKASSNLGNYSELRERIFIRQFEEDLRMVKFEVDFTTKMIFVQINRYDYEIKVGFRGKIVKKIKVPPKCKFDHRSKRVDFTGRERGHTIIFCSSKKTYEITITPNVERILLKEWYYENY